MTDDSKKMIVEFEKLDWFCNVGHPISNRNAKQVSSWEEALRICQSRAADNVQLESRNMLTEKLWSIAMDRYRKWNALVGEVTKKINPLLRKKILRSAHSPKLPAGAVAMIGSDLRLIIMELEYADIVAPRFFAERAKWYLAGHFPCGWEGDFPEGRLIVY